MSRARILIVEDERITAMSLQSELRALGYEVTALVSSGEDAIAKAKRHRPDLVLMDIRLEGKMSGIETAAHFHRCDDIPVVLITAYSSDDVRRSAEQAGACGFILKPYERQELDEAIRQALSLRALPTKGAQS
jgi:CheY-like chemotaxis protein